MRLYVLIGQSCHAVCVCVCPCYPDAVVHVLVFGRPWLLASGSAAVYFHLLAFVFVVTVWRYAWAHACGRKETRCV